MTSSKIAFNVLVLGVLIVTATLAADRPPVIGPNGAVSAGHPLTTAAAFEILLKGGNAFDAGVAALLTGGVVEQDLYSLGGEGLVLVYPRSEAKVTAVSARVGRRKAPPSNGTSRAAKHSMAKASIPPSFRAHFTPR
jgi:gamma-glutamyltranspeptidase